MHILGLEPTEVITQVEKSVKKIHLLLPPADRDRLRGYLSVFDAKAEALRMLVMIGNVPAEKLEKYQRLSIEKASRLAKYWKLYKHYSSFESRNPEEEKWGGAIYVGDHTIFSFSGLPDELADEAVLLHATSVLFEGSFAETAKYIVSKTRNEYLARMRY